MANPLDISQLATRIERAYEASGNQLGWRFLYSPSHVLTSATVAFIGLNPGGSVRPIDHAEFDMASGSAYCEEAWAGYPPGDSPLQRQVRGLFDLIGVAPLDVLAGNFVPFRSPSWSALRNRKGALSFARELWADVFRSCRPALVVTMGAQARLELERLLGIEEMATFPTGWGNITAKRGSNGGTTLIGLPHLSRFRIVGRPQSTTQLATIFAGLATPGELLATVGPVGHQFAGSSPP